MKLPLLRLVGAGGLCLLAAGLIWAGCRKSADGNGRLPPGDSETEAVEASLSAQQAAEAGFEVLRWSIATREAIADEVISGRLPLFEAAAGFRAVDQVKERYLPAAGNAMPGKTAEERLCRRVLAFVAARLEGSGEHKPLVGRLEDELQEQLRQHGAVTLPEFRRPQSIPWFDQ
jgi:hypothetical protein